MSNPLTLQTSYIDRDALLYMLSLPQGRKVLWDILAISGLFHQPFRAGDPEATAFNCGALNVGLIAYAECLTIDPALTAMMTKEQSDASNRSDATAVNNASSGSDDPSHTGDFGDSGNPNDSGLPGSLGLDRLTGRPFDFGRD